MITFSQFVEVFDSAPLPIDWKNCSISSGPALFGKQINPNKFGKNGMSSGPNTEKGCFAVGDQRYIIFLEFGKVSKNKVMNQVIQNNRKLTKVIQGDMNVIEVNFFRIAGGDKISYGVDKTGNTGSVFSTVLSGIQEKLNGKSTDIMVFESFDDSRTRLYRSMVKRFAVNFGMTMLDIVDIQTSQGLESVFLLIKNELLNTVSMNTKVLQPRMAGVFV